MSKVCAFKDYMAGGEQKVRKLMDALPKYRDDNNITIWLDIQWLKTDTTGKGDSVQACKWYNNESDACTHPNPNKYINCENMRTALYIKNCKTKR